MIEAEVEREFRKQVRAAGGWPIKMRLIGLAGFPDRLVLWKGGGLDFVELKRPKGKARALQKRVHEKLRYFGQQVFLIDTIEKVTAYVEHRQASRVSTASD